MSARYLSAFCKWCKAKVAGLLKRVLSGTQLYPASAMIRAGVVREAVFGYGWVDIKAGP